DLHRPLGQVGHRAVLRRGNGLSHRRTEGLGHTTGTAAGGRRLPRRGAFQGLRLLCQDSCFIIGCGLPLHK
ncbi:Helix-turn-helix domain-containing protein, partial [Dysosmobacter welbionis]